MLNHPPRLIDPILTCGNFHLSKIRTTPSTASQLGAVRIAINCTDGSLENSAIDCNSSGPFIAPPIARYLAAAVAPATARAYASDIEKFEAWGGSIPSDPQTIAEYLAAHAQILAIATMKRRLAALAVAHNRIGVPDPTRSRVVKQTMQGIRRVHGRPSHQARPVVTGDLCKAVSRMDDDLQGRRDKALLLLGFAGAFRRSELISLHVADLERRDTGLAITLRRSKTDQYARGRTIHIPNGTGRYCPVLALSAWLTASRLADGPVFRKIDRHGNVGPNALSGNAIALILKRRFAYMKARVTGISSHSLRAGYVTSAALAGHSILQIQTQTGHQSPDLVARYVRVSTTDAHNCTQSLL